jgi:hypothetical protein
MISKCNNVCIREFSSLKALTKDELLKLLAVKHPILSKGRSYL